jgi:hypothetical protein
MTYLLQNSENLNMIETGLFNHLFMFKTLKYLQHTSTSHSNTSQINPLGSKFVQYKFI